MSEFKREELTEEELREAAGGARTRQAGSPEGSVEAKKTRPVRDGKLTFRRHDGPEN